MKSYEKDTLFMGVLMLSIMGLMIGYMAYSNYQIFASEANAPQCSFVQTYIESQGLSAYPSTHRSGGFGSFSNILTSPQALVSIARSNSTQTILFSHNSPGGHNMFYILTYSNLYYTACNGEM